DLLVAARAEHRALPGALASVRCDDARAAARERDPTVSDRGRHHRARPVRGAARRARRSRAPASRALAALAPGRARRLYGCRVRLADTGISRAVAAPGPQGPVAPLAHLDVHRDGPWRGVPRLVLVAHHAAAHGGAVARRLRPSARHFQRLLRLGAR